MTLWISRSVADDMVREAKQYHPLETGGILLGWHHDEDVIVMGIVGPGPLARHERHTFRPDHDWQMGELRRAFEASGGDLDYVGDWHTHPDGLALMSAADRRTLRRIGKTVASPLMMITGIDAKRMGFGAWSLGERRWFMREILPLSFRIFDPVPSWPTYSSYSPSV